MRIKKLIALLVLSSMAVLSGCNGGVAETADTSIKVEDTEEVSERITTPLYDGDDTDDDTEKIAADTDISDVETEGETETEEVAEQETRLHFWGAGDNIIYSGSISDAARHAESGEDYNFRYVFADMADEIASADIAFINQETLMCGEGYEYSYYPRFNSPQKVGIDLVSLGFDVVNIANNHMLDKAEKGLQSTISFWKSQPVLMIGGYSDYSDYKSLHIIERNGVKIAFLAYTYGTNGLSQKDGDLSYIPYLKFSEIEDDIAQARAAADFVFVSAHWGDENDFEITETQKKYAQIFADCGADVIIGHHPHVIQPIEYIEGKSGNFTLCIYSLGNFYALPDNYYNIIGGYVEFDIVYSESEKKIENVEFTPTMIYYPSNFKNLRVYRLSDVTEDICQTLGFGYYGKKNPTLETLWSYVERQNYWCLK